MGCPLLSGQEKGHFVISLVLGGPRECRAMICSVNTGRAPFFGLLRGKVSDKSAPGC